MLPASETGSAACVRPVRGHSRFGAQLQNRPPAPPPALFFYSRPRCSISLRLKTDRRRSLARSAAWCWPIWVTPPTSILPGLAPPPPEAPAAPNSAPISLAPRTTPEMLYSDRRRSLSLCTLALPGCVRCLPTTFSSDTRARLLIFYGKTELCLFMHSPLTLETLCKLPANTFICSQFLSEGFKKWR